ncbi:MAG TPA: hypothetical protein VE309_00100, partial [Caulobacteraceae bacterium]|nr:hypothetical protein [Caulobacteraceae bacterium]
MLETVDDRWARTLQHKAEAYAGEAFDVALALEPLRPANLPFYILDRYRFWRGDLFGRACIFMAPNPEGGQEGMAELARHRATVASHTHADLVILLFDALLPR